MPQTKKKSEKLWHSQVAKAAQGMAVKLSSEVKEGKFGPYCFVRCHGEDEDRLFSLDSTSARDEYESVREKVGADKWVVMEAAGAKEAATLFFSDANGNPILDGEAAQLEDAPFSHPAFKGGQEAPAAPPQKPETEPREAASNAVTDLYLDCLKSAAEAVRRFHTTEERAPSEIEMRIATTMFIQRRS